MTSHLTSALAGISAQLPASNYAQQQLRHAAKAGFRWPNSDLVVGKIKEELAEVEEAIADNDKTKIHKEIGDLLHAVHTLAEFHGISAPEALASTNHEFAHRFTALEREAQRRGTSLKEMPLKEQIGIWNAQKKPDSPAPTR